VRVVSNDRQRAASAEVVEELVGAAGVAAGYLPEIEPVGAEAFEARLAARAAAGARGVVRVRTPSKSSLTEPRRVTPPPVTNSTPYIPRPTGCSSLPGRTTITMLARPVGTFVEVLACCFGARIPGAARCRSRREPRRVVGLRRGSR
jgi:hypothetical protein